ncbi:MAG: OmpA family protein [Myxococcales bacterium]|nr:OmpA family protein [Myxococcales bacterium]
MLPRLSRLLRNPKALGPALAAMMLVLPGAGCKNKNYPQCKKDKHCKQELGETCVDGSCQNCKTDAECVGKGPAGGPAWVCHEFRCMDPAEAAAGGGGGGNGEMGAPCTQTVECVGGLVCTAGACAGCTDDIECSPSTCNFDTGRCGAAGQCTTDDQCPMDEICDGGMCIFSGGGGDGGGGPCNISAVFFAFDSDTLTPKSQEELTGAASCIAEQGVEVILEAHADAVGTEEYNIMLTERRGASVRTFLVEQGVSGDLLRVLAKGSLEASGSTESERAKDRRVQLIWP